MQAWVCVPSSSGAKADKIPQQSRAATGVRLQRLDAGDRLSEVVLVPPDSEDQDQPDDRSDPSEVAGVDDAPSS